MFYQNPYDGLNFFQFFKQLAIRLWAFVTGNLSPAEFASDEIQILVLVSVAISCALVGSFLVLRKMTMLANSLSHTILLGIVLAFFFSYNPSINDPHQPMSIELLLLAALGMGFITTFLTEFINKVARLQEDASIGLVFTSLFALGVVLVTLLTRNMHIGIEAVMGNVDALHLEDLKLVLIILALNILMYLLFFKEFTITTFDPGLSFALGISPSIFNYVLMAQMSITSIGAFRAVGVLMVLAFITGPVLSARLFTHDLKRMIFLAIAIGVATSITGVALSRHLLSVHNYTLSTSGLVVCCITAFFLIAVAYHSGKKFYAQPQY